MVCRIEVRVDDREVISDAAEKDLRQVNFRAMRGGERTQKRQVSEPFRPADCAVPHGTDISRLLQQSAMLCRSIIITRDMAPDRMMQCWRERGALLRG